MDCAVHHSDADAVKLYAACVDLRLLCFSGVNCVVSDADSPLLLVLYSGDATDAGLPYVCVFSPR
jgi:hypothetical protein